MRHGCFGAIIVGLLTFWGAFILGFLVSSILPSFDLPNQIGTVIGASIVPSIIGFFTFLE